MAITRSRGALAAALAAILVFSVAAVPVAASAATTRPTAPLDLASCTTAGVSADAGGAASVAPAEATAVEAAAVAKAARVAADAKKKAPPAITLTSPAGPVTVDAERYTLSGTAGKHSSVYVWVDEDGDGARDRGEPLAGRTVARKKQAEWSVRVRLQQDSVNRFVITDFLAPWRASTAIVVPPITEASGLSVSQPTVAPGAISPNGDGIVDAATLSYALSREASATVAVANADGQVVRTLVSGETRPAGSRSETWDGLADDGSVVPDGVYTLRVDAVAGSASAAQRTVDVRVDTTGPEVSIADPAADARTADRALAADAADISGVASVAFEWSADGSSWNPAGDPDTAAPYLGSLPADLPDGTVQVRATAVDGVGVASVSPTVAFTLDTTGPEAPSGLTAADIPDDEGGAVALAWTPSASDDVAAQCVLRAIDAGEYDVVAALDPGATAYTDTGLVNGTTYAYVLQAVDAQGNAGARSLAATVIPEDNRDRTAPDTTITEGPEAETTQGTATFTFESSEAAASFECSLDDGDWTACATPLELSALAVGEHTLRVRATDAAGNTDDSPATWQWTVTEAPDGLPSDPSTVATPIDLSVPTTVAESTEFLYAGDDPIQVGVADGAIVAERAGVVRGRVLDRAGEALPGVTVSIADHPELGHTLSRADGAYDLAVNGGGALTVRFEAEGHPVAERGVEPGWNDYIVLDDVVLVAFDEKVTEVDFSDAVEVARGTPVTDAWGTRQATLLFEQATEAEIELPDGTTQTLDEVHVRATEFTVGDSGPAAMPGELPAASGYTYAAEFSIDEAVEAGATTVTFSKPVVNYTENFLGFPVGSTVPTGYYDRDKSAWVAAPNGRVVKVLRIEGGKAVLDIDGKGVAATAAALTALGVDDAELAKLAELYDAGTSLWRVSIDHFTPWDHNWPFGPPPGAEAPKIPELREDLDLTCQNTLSGSVIGCDNLTLGERLAVAGTDRALAYQTERTPGRADRTVVVPITGATVPAGVKAAEMHVEVAGRSWVSRWDSPSANITTNASWDGKDAYGRHVQGAQLMTISVGYTYDGSYATAGSSASAFGVAGSGAITGSRTREEVTLWSTQVVPVGGFDARAAGLGGWTLSGVHAYDPIARELARGDGTVQGGDDIATIIRTFAGTGTRQNSGDGGPATDARLGGAQGLAVGPDGSVYISDVLGQSVRRIGPDGVITTIVGGDGVQANTGDGGPAVDATLMAPQDVAVGPDGTIYVAAAYVVRAITPDGIIHTVAGTPNTFGWGGDGGPATSAFLYRPTGIDVAPDGTLYIADSGACVVRAVGTDGIIRTVAGVLARVDAINPACGTPVEGAMAAKSLLKSVTDVAVEPDGSLLVVDSGNNRIRRVAPDGTMRTVVGGGTTGDGTPAVTAKLLTPRDVVPLPDGGFAFSEYGTNAHRVRIVGVDGIVRALAGTGVQTPAGGANGDGGPAVRATLSYPYGLGVLPDGALLINEAGAYRVRAVSSALPGTSLGDIAVPSSDGAELYEFEAGRHVRTLDTITGALRAEIAYDEAGRIASVTDGDGDVTHVERDEAGVPVAIVAPGGQRTAVTTDAAGYLASVTAPGDRTTRLTSTPTGLLETLTEPGGGVHRFTYTGQGLLHKDEAPDGVSTTLARTASPTGQTVTATTTLGRTTTYAIERMPDGGMRRTVTAPSGAVTVGTVAGGGVARSIVQPDGTKVDLELGPDPRFGMAAPAVVSETLTTPAGLKSVTKSGSTAVLADPKNQLSLLTLTRTAAVNGRTSTSVIDVANRTFTATTAEGRVRVARFDDRGRVVRIEPGAGIEPVERSFDDHGRPERVEQGERWVEYAYDDAGRLTGITAAGGSDVTLGYDDADRVTAVSNSSDGVTRYAYDENDSLVSITRPSGRVHELTYDAGGRIVGNDPAGEGEWATAFNRDGAAASADRPGTTTAYGYDDAGRLDSASEPSGVVSFAHAGPGGTTSSVSVDSGAGGTAQTRSFTLDGALLTGMTLTGALEASWTYSYDADFAPVGVTFASGGTTSSWAQQFDKDLAVVKTGPFAIARDGRGAATSFGDGTAALAYDYDAYGDLDQIGLVVAGTEVYGSELTAGAAGTVERRIERVGEASESVEFDHDVEGRLTEVRRDGAVVERYAYDADGRRTGSGVGDDAVEYVYDDADRLVTAGEVAYEYAPDGTLAKRGDDEFVYGFGGNLVSATVEGATVTYGYDAEGRRTTRTDATGTTAYLYGSLGSPYRVSAVRAPDGTLTTLWYDEYGTLAAFDRGGARYYVATDQVGSPRVVADAGGNIVKTVRYDAFGRVLEDSAPDLAIPLGFAGGLTDAATGLVRFGARDYEPQTGRWTTPDPIGLAGGQLDLYAYVGQDPVDHRDPSGLAEEDLPADFDYLHDTIPAPSLWENLKERFSGIKELALQKAYEKAKSYLNGFLPVKIDPDERSMTVGWEQSVEIDGEEQLKVGAECSGAITENKSENPYKNIFDDLIDFKLKLSAELPALQKIPFFGDNAKLEEEYKSSWNGSQTWNGLFKKAHDAQDIGGIDRPTGNGGPGN